MLKTLFLSILAFVLLSLIHAKATNYYINSNIGKDSNQGTTKGSPWKGFANLEKNRYLPGDSILFANGTSYKGGFIFLSSGTPEKNIVFSSYSLHPDSIRTIPRNKLDSLFFRYGGGPAPAFTNPDWNVLSGNIFHIKGSCVTIDGLYFFNNAYPPGSDHKNKNVQKMGTVYFALGSNYNVIKNCEFFHTPVGIKVKGSNNLITHNYLHDSNNKLAYSWGPMAIMIVKPNNEICYNTITNYGSYGGPYGSDGGVIELDGVDDDFEGKNVNIHHNISINNHGFLELAGRGMDSITIAYNLSDDTNQFIGGGSMKNIFVYNNTIVRTREPNVDRYIFWTFDPENTSMTLRNNIFVVPPDIQVFGPMIKYAGHHRSRIGNQIHDHNLYFSVDNGADPLGGIPKGDGDIIANPGFVDFVNRNFRLKSGSPAINAGIQVGFKMDIDGRNIDERPDIGAFEY